MINPRALFIGRALAREMGRHNIAELLKGVCMGREVRMVPADWQPPKIHTWRLPGPQWVEVYRPQLDGGLYCGDVDEWDAECAKWKAGARPDDLLPGEAEMTYEQFAGQRPHRDDYMPDWPDEQRTHYMMYENTSEGTPISPAFPTVEELARWLADNGASWFGHDTASYETWIAEIRLQLTAESPSRPDTPHTAQDAPQPPP